MKLRFSQRKGLTPIDRAFQRDKLDEPLRNQLWNILKIYVWDKWSSSMYGIEDAQRVEDLVTFIWHHHFQRPLDAMAGFDPTDTSNASSYGMLRHWVLQADWYKVLDLVEYIVQNVREEWRGPLVVHLNMVLEGQNAAYRIVGEEIAEITDEVEIAAITEALESDSDSVGEHLRRALALLSDRDAPDFRNSIKESISAVEAACQRMAGNSRATLGDCLKEIRKSHPIHSAMEQALYKLYGWTSDGGGIRHALSDDDAHPTYADAKFMFVSCATFTNYLAALQAQSNTGKRGTVDPNKP